MRFVDLLRATVRLSGVSATALIIATLIAATNDQAETLARVATGWWAVAILVGLMLSRRHDTNASIAGLLADAKQATTMPEIRPVATLLNRLWPLLVVVIGAAAVAGPVGPQVPAIVAGVCIIWAMSWRRQALAVIAIEERDGVTFFVVKTSPLRRIKLERAPGFRRERTIDDGAAAPDA